MNQVTETALSLLNDIAVGTFGILLSMSFGGVLSQRRFRLIIPCCIVLLLFFNGLIYSIWSAELGTKLYPLIVHLPLVVLICILSKKPLWSLISVLSAYLFCEIRRWFALLAAELLAGNIYTRKTAEIIITIPLLLILIHLASPAIQKIMYYPIKTQCLFGLVPAIYYAFDYVTRIYTNLLYEGSPAALEFMPFVCCVAYLIFLLYNFAEEHKKQQLRQTQRNLDIRLSQAVREITRLRDSQTQAIHYRHDLRHHLQYLSNCLENNQTKRAQDYISNICGEIETQKIRRYCENETANLIISAFAERANKNGVEMDVQGALTDDIKVSDNDLCALLSNSLENALHACLPLAESGEKCVISMQFRPAEASGKFFLQISNPYRGEVKFENGIPISIEPDHGIGVKSICYITERYDGYYSFSLEDGYFILRLSL